jgi:rhamnosyltransferase
VRGIVIVDNASNPAAVAMLRELAEQSGAALIENADNLGVATALNQGVAHARAEGFSWFITFDQDSAAGPTLIEGMLAVCATLSGAELDHLGVLGVNHVDAHTGETYVAANDSPGASMERKTVITSGSLLSVKAYEAIGPFRDEFFIDAIDHEYCLRARSKNYRVLLALAPRLVHAMGQRKHVRLLPGISVATTNHAPFRWYSIVRNRLILVREYGRREPSWAAFRLLNLIVMCLRTLAFEADRVEKARNMCLGIADFARKHSTRHPGELMRSSRV